MDHTITVRGPRQEVAEFIQDLKSLTPAELSTTYSTPVPDALSRKPFGQFEIIQALVTFATSVSASVAAAEIQQAIKGWREKHKDSRLEIEQSPSAETSAPEVPHDES